MNYASIAAIVQGHRRNQRASLVNTGSLPLNWKAPATMGDGSPITGLTGFKVYWSQTQYDLAPPNSASVPGAGSLAYTVTGLASGTWYAWVSSITAAGESALLLLTSQTI